MKVARDTVVTLDVVLADLWGNVLQESESPVAYLHGGYDEMLPAVEAALEGKSVGEKVSLDLEPEDAFGEYDESLLRVEPRAEFPEALEVGMQFEGIPGGDSEDTVYTVTDVAEDRVVLDGNHPLAGIAVRFTCKVRAVREATRQEIEQGYAEDPSAVRVRIAGDGETRH
jgi:FKBP-type peptidyl-prolyl cis-trans isomerase SlyD